VNPDSLVSWLPPEGMTARLDSFEPREGGAYRMVLTYEDADHAVPGKTSEHCDVVRGWFLELVADQLVVQRVAFESADPLLAGAMTMTWTFTPAPGGTKVTILCENVPEGIRAEDHEAGLTSTLANLAAFTEGREVRRGRRPERGDGR
jgi:uncharacterized protein YndB with AHSA1/START domain